MRLAGDNHQPPTGLRRRPAYPLPLHSRTEILVRFGIQPFTVRAVCRRRQNPLPRRHLDLQGIVPIRALLVDHQAAARQLRPRGAFGPQPILPGFPSLPAGEPGLQAKTAMFSHRVAEELPPLLGEVGGVGTVPFSIEIARIVPGPAHPFLFQLLQLPGEALLVQLARLPEPGDKVAVVEGRFAEKLQQGGVGWSVHFESSQS